MHRLEEEKKCAQSYNVTMLHEVAAYGILFCFHAISLYLGHCVIKKKNYKKIQFVAIFTILFTAVLLSPLFFFLFFLNIYFSKCNTF